MIKNILEYLERTAEMYPDRTAFSDGERDMTFGELLRKARSAGSYILSRGYTSRPIAVLGGKDAETVALMLGVVYSGCFYSVIDDTLPRDRINRIINTLCPPMIIYDGKHGQTDKISDFFWERAERDAVLRYPEDSDALMRVRERQIDLDPIYVVFTSGSTGEAKGVVACHRSVIDYCEALGDAIGFDGDTVFGCQSPLFLDAPLKEIMSVLRFGAKAYLIPKKLFMFPVMLCDYLNKYKINTICWVSAALSMISSFGVLEKNRPEYLKTVCFGSEVLPRTDFDAWRRALPNTVFYNLYGPTEATGMSAYFRVDRELSPDEPIPIGKPFNNTDIFLIKDGRKVENYEETGEICIRGTALTLGYFGDRELTQKVFCPDPLFPDILGRVYMTGDIGKYNTHGELVFVSRKKGIIKHMGYKIDLSEIEETAKRCDEVRKAASVYDGTRKTIALFYEGDANEGDVFSFLKKSLPVYALPRICKKLDRIPLTQNYKTDRQALTKLISEGRIKEYEYSGNN